MIEVILDPGGRRVDLSPGQTLMDAGRQANGHGQTSIEAPCGGKGHCGQCRVMVRNGAVPPPNNTEKAFITPADLDRGVRLACQCTVLEPVRIEIPPESMGAVPNLQISGSEVHVDLDPPVRRLPIRLQPTTRQYPVPLWQQVDEQLTAFHGIEKVSVAPHLIQEHDPIADDKTVAVTLRGCEVVGLHADEGAPPALLGMAVDLGTTKVAGYLVDLESGKLLSTEGVMNPQTRLGADVISRLTHASGDPHAAVELSRLARDCIGHLAKTMARRCGVAASCIEQVVIAANTAMHHFLLQWPIRQLGQSPYLPASSAPVMMPARELGLDVGRDAATYLLPPVAGFVGGDHLAMILATGIDKNKAVTLGLDIGTNTELVLAYDGKLYSCSCASGPAFEGAQIRQGVRAVPGAVYAVRMDSASRVILETIAGKPPVGLCGSGVVDAIAQLARHGIISALGALDRRHPLVELAPSSGEPRFLLSKHLGAKSGRKLSLGQKDIAAIQLAKAAVGAGTCALMATAGIAAEDIEQVVIAGAFGTHLNLQSAIDIGLLPKLPVERFHQVGNAAGTGARMVLVSQTEQQRAETLGRRINYIELGGNSDFQRWFSHSLKFPRLAP
ncbi:MAG: ASKHA domain-containing protein [Desulfobacteraceae bacterium]